ncbi:MAG: cytochrome c oxidase subunit II [Myxococcota bacterium]|nr:cytochrome c oxidase subunit II [Myxococcota bacterium]
MSGLRLPKKLLALTSTLFISSMSYAAVQPESGYGFPRDVSVEGERIDWLLNVTNGFAALLFVVMVVWMGIAIFKHNRNHTPDYDYGTSKHSVYTACVVSALIFFVVDGNLFYNSIIDVNEIFWNYGAAETEETVRIEVNGRQWAWSMRYPGPDKMFNTKDDIVTLNDMRVPVNKPVSLQLGAIDVIHSFFLPNLRIKNDAMPGMINRLWFEAKETGEFDIACTQHCGTYHYKMKGKLTILEQDDYDAWLKEAQINSERDYDETDAQAHWGWKWREM